MKTVRTFDPATKILHTTTYIPDPHRPPNTCFQIRMDQKVKIPPQFFKYFKDTGSTH